MPLPLLALPALGAAEGVGTFLAAQGARTLATSALRSLATRAAGGALARGAALEGEFIAGSGAARAAGSTFDVLRKTATVGEILPKNIFTTIAKRTLGNPILSNVLLAADLLKNVLKSPGAKNVPKPATPKPGRGGLGGGFLGGLVGSGLSSLFGGGDGGGDVVGAGGGGGGTELANVDTGEALGAGLPTVRSPSIPSLPVYNAKKNGCCGEECCAITNRLLSIAIKYLAGIDTTLKNQLDVQRASFTQANQTQKEMSLEEKGTGGGVLSPIMSAVRKAGTSVVSFFGNALLNSLAIGAPMLLDSIGEKFSQFLTDKKEPGSTNVTPQNGMVGDKPLTRRGRRDDISPRLNATESGEAIKNVLRREGGYVNDPVDKGGETKFGISKRAYPNLDIKNLTEAQAATIYKRDYWDKINADQLPANIREMAFDSAVNHGVSWTKEALRKSNNDPQKFLALRKEKYQNIVANDPSQGKFLRGWMNRLEYFSAAPAETPMMAAASLVTTPPVASTRINDAAIEKATRESLPAAQTAMAPNVLASRGGAPANQTAVMNSSGPGNPSSPYNPATMMDLVKYFSPMPA